MVRTHLKKKTKFLVEKVKQQVIFSGYFWVVNKFTKIKLIMKCGYLKSNWPRKRNR